MSDLSGAKLASDGVFKAIANNILQPNGAPQDLTHGDADAKLQTVIKNIYKEDSNSFKNNFFQPVVELTVATGPGAADKGSVQTMVATTQGVNALSYLQGQAFTRQRQTSSIGSSRKEQADCDGQEENKCKGKCEWDKKEGMCKAKAEEEGVKAEGKKEEKCKGKEQKYCEQATNCKWEG
ncbi:hypothetical protein DPX39_060059500 [Trypanosoma brucei equiperdum]|uniref:Trypanosome variant surface glycoprotein C-terminal domain containing protein n=1 Tax=Trypanosoma brucei equiperdum TaxID=630700 RepID=A0A3L6L9L0_9TRYP|nr:hypothetical protein DPX39_060059500 [Trypanosoma brucei equiperdum]